MAVLDRLIAELPTRHMAAVSATYFHLRDTAKTAVFARYIYRLMLPYTDVHQGDISRDLTVASVAEKEGREAARSVLKEDFMATAPTLFRTLQQRLSYRTRERWFRRVVERRKPERVPGFFDANSAFLTSSHTAATANRLNERHRAMIESNRDIISGCRVLDLASHDGRWSFAAAQSGASYVLGIEARPHLVAAAREHLSHQPVSNRIESAWGTYFLSEHPSRRRIRHCLLLRLSLPHDRSYGALSGDSTVESQASRHRHRHQLPAGSNHRGLGGSH